MIKKFSIFCVVLSFLLLFSISCNAQIYASDYAPIYYFEGEESCYPINPAYYIEDCYLYEVGNIIPISTNPTSYELANYSSEQYQYYFLDNQLGTIEKPSPIIDIYKNIPNTVYYREYTDSGTGTIVIQYWTFFAFNFGELNQHEGDWEMVQIVIKDGAPSWVAYSQHHSGQKASWTQVDREGNHIKVYVARGSHANYLRSFSGKLGVANDIVGANGKILKPASYTLEPIDDQPWLNYFGRWGVCGSDSLEFSSFEALGKNGPSGPMYRENGEMWNNPVSWGQNLPQANDMMFTLEWFIYNFVLIFFLITALSIGIMLFFIYKRHKKYGLGPRIVSIFYIDGANLKSIGNILCIIGIVIVIAGLFLPWYHISYDISKVGKLSAIETSGGMQYLMKIDGMKGAQISVPGQGGPTPIGNLTIPFSLFIGIGIIFLIISSIGISHSKKLGVKYIWRGIRIMIPIILILIVIIAIGSFIPVESIPSEEGASSAFDILKSISGAPFGGEKIFYIGSHGSNVPLPMSWGLGLGAQLILFGGVIMIAAGITEFIANTQFFQSKELLEGSSKKLNKKDKASKIEPVTSQKKSKQNDKFCTQCGEKLNEKATFCTKCGKKI